VEPGVDRASSTTPAAFNMKSRIQAFLNNNPHLDPKIERSSSTCWHWSTRRTVGISLQALDGFNQQLLLNVTGVFLGTSRTSQGTPPLDTKWSLPDLIGPVHGNPPRLGEIPESAPYDPSRFLPWRCGQFIFKDLKVVDEWGQAVWPITLDNYKLEQIYLPPEMTANPRVRPNIGDSVVQLTPALLQPGRLDFDLISASDDNHVIGLAPDADPICGWVLPNHLDASLMAYDAQGQAHDFSTITLAGNDATNVCWTDAPGSPYHGLDDIRRKLKHFGPFL
jgi:hypothetical protein